MNTEQWELLLGGMSGENVSNVIERQEKRGQRTIERSEKLPLNKNKHTGKEDPTYKDKLTVMGIAIGEEIDDLFMSVQLPEGWRIKGTDHSMWSNLVDDEGRNRASIFYKAAFYDRDAYLSFNKRFSVSYKISDYDEKLYEHQPKVIEDGTYMVWIDEGGNELKDNKGIMEFEWISEKYSEYGYTKNNRFKREERTRYKKNPDYIELTGYEKYSQPFHYEVHDHDGALLFSSDVVKTEYEYSKDKHGEFFAHMEEVEEKAKQQCYNWLEKHYPDWKNDLAYWE
jgi:hypothetical protein